MGRPKQVREPLPTIWRTPDELWALVEPILTDLDPPASTGRPRVDPRAVLDALIFRRQSGCQGNWLPQEYPDDSSVHRTVQRWIKRGVFERLWAVRVERCEDLGGVDWEWQAADGWLGQARTGGAWWAPTPPIVRRTA